MKKNSKLFKVLSVIYNGAIIAGTAVGILVAPVTGTISQVVTEVKAGSGLWKNRKQTMEQIFDQFEEDSEEQSEPSAANA